MKPGFVALTPMVMAVAFAVSACSDSRTALFDQMQAESQGYGSDYAPLGQDHHNR
jgi:hypothetical protein